MALQTTSTYNAGFAASLCDILLSTLDYLRFAKVIFLRRNWENLKDFTPSTVLFVKSVFWCSCRNT